MAHESGYGGKITSDLTLPWESPQTQVQEWSFVDRYSKWDITAHGGANYVGGVLTREYDDNLDRRRAKMLGTEDEISAEVVVLVPGSWATGPGTGYKAGITPITINLFKNSAERITIDGFIDSVRIVSPLEGATLMRLTITGDGTEPVYA